MKIIEIKKSKIAKSILALATATALAVLIAGCDEPTIKNESSQSSSTSTYTVDAPILEEPNIESSSIPEVSSSSEEEVQEPEPTPPEKQYSEWVLGEWTTDVYEETDTCRLANQTEKQEQAWTNWSNWSTDPVEASDTREVKTKVEYGEIIEKYVQLPKVGPDGYIIEGEYVWRPKYLVDEEGHPIYGETTYYSYRDLTGTNSYTLYQYETREVLNQKEIDQFESEKKLVLAQE